MTQYYYRTTFDDFKEGLEDFHLTNPPTPREGIFTHFCEDVKPLYLEGKVVLAVTVTIHPKLKYNNKLVWDMSPQRQYEAVRFMLNNALRKYHKKYSTGIRAYFFFEFTQQGKIHAHGIVSQLNEDLYYPVYISQLTPLLRKQGFRSFGTRVEYIKYWDEWVRYISKDAGKHKFSPLYVFI